MGVREGLQKACNVCKLHVLFFRCIEVFPSTAQYDHLCFDLTQCFETSSWDQTGSPEIASHVKDSDTFEELWGTATNSSVKTDRFQSVFSSNCSFSIPVMFIGEQLGPRRLSDILKAS